MKRISELSRDELTRVYENNERLQSDVFADYEESQMYYIKEQLDCFRDGLKNWEIGFGSQNYMQVGDRCKFLDGLEICQKDYCTLPDNANDYIKIVREKTETLDNMEYGNENYENLDNWINKKINLLKNMILDVFNNITNNYKLSDIQEYFLDFYSECRMDDTYYINDDNDQFVLYQHIEYEKCFLRGA